MWKTRMALAGLATALLVGVSGCASGGAGMEGEPEASEDQVAVEIRNDLVPGETVVVWMVPETGSRRRLGSLSPNARQTFRYRPTARGMDYQLVAELSGGGEERSQRFTLTGVNTVRWQVSSPTISVGR